MMVKTFLIFSEVLAMVSKTKPGFRLLALVQQPGKRGREDGVDSQKAPDDSPTHGLAVGRVVISGVIDAIERTPH